MPKTAATVIAAALCLLTVAPSWSVAGLTAQVNIQTREPVRRLVVGARVHTQMNTTSVAEEVEWQWSIRRARLYLEAQINEWLDGVAQVDWAGENAEGRLLFIRGTFDPAFRVSIGQFKRAFDLFELTSSSMILVIERAGRVRGVDTCSGTGGMCTYSRFSEALQHSSLDVGVLVDGEFNGERGSYRLSVTNGAGRNRGDENDAKSMGARVAYRVRPDLGLGANVSFHDHPNPETERDGRAPAIALDAEWGGFESGPHVQLGLIFGENWKNPNADGVGSDFLAWQGIATYRAPVDLNPYVRGIEPLLRVSYGDPDRSTGSDDGWLITPGVVAHFDGRNKVAVNLDAWSPSAGRRAWGLLLQTYFHF